jgi:hypothetical protein
VNYLSKKHFIFNHRTKIGELNLTVMNLENEISELKAQLEMSAYNLSKTRNRGSRVSFSTNKQQQQQQQQNEKFNNAK